MWVVSVQNIFHWKQTEKRKKRELKLRCLFFNKLNQLENMWLLGKENWWSSQRKSRNLPFFSFFFLLAGIFTLIWWSKTEPQGNPQTQRWLVVLPSVWTPSRAGVIWCHLGDSHPADTRRTVQSTLIKLKINQSVERESAGCEMPTMQTGYVTVLFQGWAPADRVLLGVGGRRL